LKVCEKLEKIEQALNLSVHRNGSTVDSDDCERTFGFSYCTIDLDKDNQILSWDQADEFIAFRAFVKEKILLQSDQFIEFANDATKLEESTLRPVLQEVLSELASKAFSDFPNKEIIIDRFEYDNAKIEDPKGRLHIFHGLTDLSCIIVPKQIPVCGFENKITNKSLIFKRTIVEDVNAEGKKAMAQIATQILGAVVKLHQSNIAVPAYSQIGTNGWQYFMVRRIVEESGGNKFVATIPISMGEVSSNGKEIIKKPVNDKSYDLIAHMITMMFDNARFLIKKKRNQSALTIPFHTLKFDEQRDEGEGDRDDNYKGKNIKSSSALPAPPHNQRSIHKSNNNNHNRSKETSHATDKKDKTNVINILPLTVSSLRYHNSLY
jgi:hypothetical protein